MARTGPPHLILASASPRRQEILRSLGLRPEVRPVDLDETRLPGESPGVMVERLAREKAARAAAAFQGGSAGKAAPVVETIPGARPPQEIPVLVLGADTAVVLEGEAFGKPSG